MVDLNVVIMVIKEEISSEGKYEWGVIINIGLLKIVFYLFVVYIIFWNLIDNGLKYNELEILEIRFFC